MTSRVDSAVTPSRAITRVLPPECIGIVLSFADLQDLQAISLVNKRLHSITKPLETCCEDAMVTAVAKFFQRATPTLAGAPLPILTALPPDITMPRQLNSALVRSCLLMMVNASRLPAPTASPSPTDRNALQTCIRQASRGPSIAQIFVECGLSIGKTYIGIDLANRDRGFVLCEIARELGQQNLFDMAIKVARLIPNDISQEQALHKIAAELAKKGLFDKAIEVAKTIPNESFKAAALHQIAAELAKKGLFDKAIEVAKTIPNESFKAAALHKIAAELAKKGLFDKAIEVAKTIPEESFKAAALHQVAAELAKKRSF